MNSPRQQHVFQPVASKSDMSPMTRKTTWLEAFRFREEMLAEWRKTTREPDELPPDPAFSYKKVGTREIVDKTRADSFTCSILPFKDDKWFLDAYINASGRLRIGQIFQDLDALAGVIAYKHCSPADPVIVTASVDRIYMLKRLDDLSGRNVTLSGSVTWSGKSSMEITIKAASHKEDMGPDTRLTEKDIKDEDVFLMANFTFVARDPETNRSFAINRLVPQNADERVDFVRAEKFNNAKKVAAKETALEIQPPSEEEARIIHDMWIKQKQFEKKPELKPANMVDMKDTQMFSTSVMQPQYRNRHSYMIFGGYLMRQTFELAYACAAAFARDTPRFVSLDSTTFRAPVPVGSVLYLTSTVAYTEQTMREIKNADGEYESIAGTLVQVRVDSTVRDLDYDKYTETGTFTYSYFVRARPDSNQKTQLLPQSYNEMMVYVEGRRRAIDSAKFYIERQLGRGITE
ncbi:hypothetical protein TRVA0_015S01750 [Trichomonascus vanleenenianus]|uniref:uncharacterized protein n=1 Tax=Trichomonascus vanleenenianus TaxID=2268995 RepID=UPI003EC9CB3B